MGVLVKGYFRLISKLSEKTSDLGVLGTIPADIPSTSPLVLLSLPIFLIVFNKALSLLLFNHLV